MFLYLLICMVTLTHVKSCALEWVVCHDITMTAMIMRKICIFFNWFLAFVDCLLSRGERKDGVTSKTSSWLLWSLADCNGCLQFAQKKATSIPKSACAMQTTVNCCNLLGMKTTAKTFLGNRQLLDGHGLISQPLCLGPYLLVPTFSP